MRILTSMCVAALTLAAGACGDRDWTHHLGHGQSGGSGPGVGNDELADFVGSWREVSAAPGYDSYLLVEASGQGYLCNEDGKSQAKFLVLIEAGEAFMGDYEYGTGDALSVNGQGTLVRDGEDHGESYTVRYAHTNALPAWCQQQIDEMKAE